ncbi:glycosyltransferase [Streptomyces sp. NPDC059063]|uniref:glycosyltransferase n=1 Tax=unclassified Streptomyces TaxID=2593676 RepID=UPI0036D18486
MRIGLLTEGGYPYVGGEARLWCDRLVRGLGQHEFDVYALSRSERQEALGWVDLPPQVRRVRSAPLWTAGDGTGGLRFGRGLGLGLGRGTRRRFADCFGELAGVVCAGAVSGTQEGSALLADRFGSALYGLADLAREQGGIVGALRSEVAVRALESACRAPGAPRAARAARVPDLLAVADRVERVLRPLSLDWYGPDALGAVDLCHATAGGGAALPGLLARHFAGVPLLVTEYGVRLRAHYLAGAPGLAGARNAAAARSLAGVRNPASEWTGKARGVGAQGEGAGGAGVRGGAPGAGVRGGEAHDVGVRGDRVRGAGMRGDGARSAGAPGAGVHGGGGAGSAAAPAVHVAAEGMLSAPARALLASFHGRLATEVYREAAVITPGNAHARRWQERCGADPAKLRTVHPGLEAGRFGDVGEREHPGEPFTLLWVGRVEPAKDLISLLHAFAEVRRHEPRARLRVVGALADGPDAAAYLAHCRALAAQLFPDEADGAYAVGANPVSFEEIGGPEAPDLAAAYAAGCVVVLSSVVEGFPISLVEAMLCGRATVSTDVGAVVEVIGGTGLVVPPRNPRALADACVALLRDPERRARLGAAARARALELFTVEQNTAAFHGIYLEIVSHCPVRREALDEAGGPVPFAHPAEAHVPGRWAVGGGLGAAAPATGPSWALTRRTPARPRLREALS